MAVNEIPRVNGTLDDLLKFQSNPREHRTINFVQLYRNEEPYLRFALGNIIPVVESFVSESEGSIIEIGAKLHFGLKKISASSGTRYDCAGLGRANVSLTRKEINFREPDESHLRQMLPYLSGWRFAITTKDGEGFRKEKFLMYDNQVIGRTYQGKVIPEISQAELIRILGELEPYERIFLKREHPDLHVVAELGFEERTAEEHISNEDIGIYVIEQGYRTRTEFQQKDRRVYDLANQRGLIDTQRGELLKLET